MWGGGPWLADTSAWARAAHPAVAENWKAAARTGELIGCPIVTLELLYDAPDRERVELVAGALAGLRQAPITRTVTDAAISAVRELAARGAACRFCITTITSTDSRRFSAPEANGSLRRAAFPSACLARRQRLHVTCIRAATRISTAPTRVPLRADLETLSVLMPAGRRRTASETPLPRKGGSDRNRARCLRPRKSATRRAHR